jgi:hypothetical protein
MQTLIAGPSGPGELSYTVARCLAESGDGGAPAAGFAGRIAESNYERRARQHCPHHLALYSDTAAVNDADGLEASGVSFEQIFFDHALDIARGYAVEVEYIGDGNADGAGLGIIVH